MVFYKNVYLLRLKGSILIIPTITFHCLSFVHIGKSQCFQTMISESWGHGGRHFLEGG